MDRQEAVVIEDVAAKVIAVSLAVILACIALGAVGVLLAAFDGP